MPKVSLVVCLYKERELLERLFEHAESPNLRLLLREPPPAVAK